MATKQTIEQVLRNNSALCLDDETDRATLLAALVEALTPQSGDTFIPDDSVYCADFLGHDNIETKK